MNNYKVLLTSGTYILFQLTSEDFEKAMAKMTAGKFAKIEGFYINIDNIVYIEETK